MIAKEILKNYIGKAGIGLRPIKKQNHEKANNHHNRCIIRYW